MTALSKLFQHLCAKAILLLAFLLIELILLIRKLKSDSRPITTPQYLKFIEEKNPTICYTKRLMKSNNVECTVCLSEFEEGEKVRNLKCKHTFHKDCLDKWLQQSWGTCPICRNKVLPDDVVSKHRQLRNQEDFDGNDEQLPFLFSSLSGGNTSYRYL